MIVDSHVYTFEPVDSSGGYESGQEHLGFAQASYARHHQPAFRLRDRAPSSAEVLNPEGVYDTSGLPDLNFRADHATGRVVWTYEGEDHTKHYYPPNLRNLEFTPQSLVGEMDYAGVDVGLVHTDPMLVRDSEYLAECMRLFPDRLRSMAPVDEWRVATETDAVIAELTESIDQRVCTPSSSTHHWRRGPGMSPGMTAPTARSGRRPPHLRSRYSSLLAPARPRAHGSPRRPTSGGATLRSWRP